jgi:apolipoprotein N-acyltransferase
VISAEPATADPISTGPGSVVLRTRWALLVSLAGGGLLAASFPPLGLWPLAVAGPALLIVALAGRTLRASLVCGLVFGLAFFVPLLSWLINVAWYAWTALAVAETVMFGLLTVGLWLLMRLRYWPLAAAAWWVTAEGIRDRWPYAFPWGRLAMSQAGAPDAGWVAVGGAPLLSFLLALTAAMIAWAVLTRFPAARPRRWLPPSGVRRLTPAVTRWLPASAAVLTAGLVLAIALVPLDPVGSAPTAVIAAIQGDVPHQRDLARQLNDTEVTQNHMTETLKLAGEVRAGQAPAPDVVIWPENSTDLDPFLPENAGLKAGIETALAAIDRPMLIGEVLNNPQLNVSQLWTPAGGPGPYYAKRQLVPFGEYIPFRGLLSKITSLPSLQPVDFVPGRNPVVFHVGQVRLGAVICYEVGFDPLVRSEVTAGANVLVVQSNDADFEIDGQLGLTRQQIAMARMRAVESDRAVVYDAITGESAIIAPDGHVIMGSGIWQPAILEARVPLITYRTLADRVGSWPEYLIIAGTVTALLFAIRTAVRRR